MYIIFILFQIPNQLETSIFMLLFFYSQFEKRKINFFAWLFNATNKPFQIGEQVSCLKTYQEGFMLTID